MNLKHYRHHKKIKLFFKSYLIMNLLFFILAPPVFANNEQTQANSPLTLSNIPPIISSPKVTKNKNIESNKVLTVTLSLNFHNSDELKHKIIKAREKNHLGRLISDQDLQDRYLPTSSEQNKVASYLESCGLNVTQIPSGHLTVQAQGTAQAIEKAFNTKINYYTKDGEEFYANSTQPQLPSDIAPLVGNIDGLNNLMLKHALSYQQLSNSSSKGTKSYTPQQIQKAYDYSSAYDANINGSGINIAIASYCAFNKNDINYFLNNYNISGTNPIKIINVGGKLSYDSDSAIETTSDVECALSSAPGAQIYVYDGANALLNTQTNVFAQIVSDGIADVVSYSWGMSESNYSLSQINTLSNLFAEGSAKGMTFLVASGDDGSNEIDYPATDPNVIAVGGTTLNINSSNKISSEYGWNDSGGGISSVFSQPTWQAGVSSCKSSYRMIPDVALNADTDTGYIIYVDGRWYQVGGTSLATPEWAAIIALVDQARVSNSLGTLGAANTQLYSLADLSVFNDITSGNNGAYSCLSGYDMVTGFGSVDVYNLVKALSGSSTTLSVPTNLTAIAVNSKEINLSWDAVTNATSYYVYRAESSSDTYAKIGASTSTSYSDTELTAGTTYYYKIIAVNDSSTSNYSDATSATTSKSDTSSFSAPENLQAIALSPSKIELSWDAVIDTDYYLIYRANSPNGKYTKIAKTVNTDYINSHLTSGKTYYYKILAVCGSQKSDYSDIISATTLTSLSTPANLTATALSSRKIKLDWDTDSYAIYYYIYRATSRDGTYIPVAKKSGSSYVNSGLKANKTYYYKIMGIDRKIKSSYSDVAYATTSAYK